jgi:hypothetical protein
MSRLSLERWTFLCVWSIQGMAILMVNDEHHSTRSLVAYDSLHPVIIRERVL